MFEARRGLAVGAVAIWIAVLPGLGCGGADEAPPRTLVGQARVPPTEGELLGFLRAADEGEADLGRWMRDQEASEAVRHYADKMVIEHTASAERFKQRADQLGTPFEESAFSRQLEEILHQTRMTLQAAPTRGLGLTYLDSQLVLHAHVAMLLDANSGRSERWSSELMAHRQAVQRHLEEAAGLQRVLHAPAAPQ